MGTKDDYTTHDEALEALHSLQRYARDHGVSLEMMCSALIRLQMVQLYGSTKTVEDILEQDNVRMVQDVVGT